MSRPKLVLLCCVAMGSLTAPAAHAQSHEERAGSTPSQPNSTEWRTKQVDTKQYSLKDAHRQLLSYATCVVNRRYKQARALAILPYGSAEQHVATGKVIRAYDDGCLYGFAGDLQMTMRSETLAGAISQVLVVRDYGDLAAVLSGYRPAVSGVSTATPVNAAELFGRCVALRNPAAAFKLLMTRTNTPEEAQAIQAIKGELGPCILAGTTMTIDAWMLRNTIGVGAYRLAQELRPRDRSGA